MAVLVPFCLLLAIDPFARAVDVSGGATAEVRGGVAPTGLRSPSEPTFLMIVTPNVDLLVRARRGGEFMLGYAPRAQLRVPNRLDIKRPIFLHQMYATYRVLPTRRLVFSVDLAASVGELDYISFNNAFDAQQSALPASALTNYAIATGTLRLEASLTPTDRLVVTPRGGYRAPFGGSRELPPECATITMPTPECQRLPTQSNGHLGLAYRHQATPVDTVGTQVTPGVVDYDGEVTYFAFEHLMLWERQIASALQSSLDFGYFVAQRVRGDRRGELKVFPVGQAIMTGRLRARATHSVEGRLAAGVTGYFDRIRDVVQPRGQAQAELTTYIPAHWAAGFNFGFFTPISRDPVVLADGTLADDETVLRLQTPVTYTINDRTAFEFGTVFSIRGSHLTTDDFRVGRFEAWAYVAVRVGGGTARGGEEVGDRGEGPIGVGNTGIGIGTGGRY